MVGNKNDIIKYLLTKPDTKQYEIKEHRQKRSLSANAYCWVLCTKIAEVLNSTKDEVYLEELKRYGQALIVPVGKDKKPDGYFKYYQFEGRRKLNDRELDFYKVFKGSSEYDSKEMSVLINGIVEDAKELGIETLEDIRIKELIKEWGE
ncbi:MAG: hypothetical protein IKE89_03565 [Bacilli bacterium]|nr:hypothetical protein [Bacilli bacterium]MBR2711530.1 hypothetical protein [Bacilli bacterium]